MNDRSTFAFIFDMDGLLIDSEPLYQQSRSFAAEDFGFSIEPDFYFDYLAGKHLNDCEEIILRKAGAEIDFQIFVERSRRYVDDLVSLEGFELKPGVVGFLNFVSSFGRCAVASGSNSSHVYASLKQTGIDEYFDVVVTRDDVSEGKPSPQLFQKAATLIGVTPERCMVFEDSNTGVSAANRAKMEVVMIPDIQKPDHDSIKAATAILSQIDFAKSVVKDFVHPRLEGGSV